LAGIEVDADIEAAGILWNCGHGDVSERLPATRAHVPTMSREAARLEIAADTPAAHAAELIPVVETPTKIPSPLLMIRLRPSGYGGQRDRMATGTMREQRAAPSREHRRLEARLARKGPPGARAPAGCRTAETPSARNAGGRRVDESGS
jgi:hypothetical protein